MASWTTLKTKKDYTAALARLDALIDKKRTAALQNEFMLLSYLIEEFEEQHLAIPDASPAEVIRFALSMKNLKQQDLVPILGTKGNVSKILNGQASLPLISLDALSKFLGIPVNSLIPKTNSENTREQKRLRSRE